MRQLHVVHFVTLKALEAVLVVEQVQVAGVLGNSLRNAMGKAMRNGLRHWLVQPVDDALGDDALRHTLSDAMRDALRDTLRNALVNALLVLNVLDVKLFRGGSPLRLPLARHQSPRGHLPLVGRQALWRQALARG